MSVGTLEVRRGNFPWPMLGRAPTGYRFSFFTVSLSLLSKLPLEQIFIRRSEKLHCQPFRGLRPDVGGEMTCSSVLGYCRMSPCLGPERGRAFRRMWLSCLNFEGQLVSGRRYLGTDNVQGGWGREACAKVCTSVASLFLPLCWSSGPSRTRAPSGGLVEWSVLCFTHSQRWRERTSVRDRGRITAGLVCPATEPAFTLQ